MNYDDIQMTMRTILFLLRHQILIYETIISAQLVGLILTETTKLKYLVSYYLDH